LINERDTLLNMNLKLRIDLRAVKRGLISKIVNAFLNNTKGNEVFNIKMDEKGFTKGHIFRGVE
jgi:hypothetical protein